MAYVQRHYDAEWIRQATCELCRWVGEPTGESAVKGKHEQLDGTIFCAAACPDTQCRLPATAERNEAWTAWRERMAQQAARCAEEHTQIEDWRKLLDEITFTKDPRYPERR